MLLCLERAKLVVEPAGAATVAAILSDPARFSPPLVAVLSGGNIDPIDLVHDIQHGLVAAGRFLTLRIDIPDRPGNLARLLTLVGDLGANVVDVVHSRVGASLRIGDVEVNLRLECRGAEHGAQIVDALDEAGFRVRHTD
jgi:threonine dehydratase